MNSIQKYERMTAMSLSAPVPGPMFTTRPFRCHPSSPAPCHIHRDGTDPLLGGHGADHQDHSAVATRHGGAA
jgi:hypothetical protein